MFGRLYETWGESVIDSRWLYKIKHDVDESIKMYKVRFITRVFSHKKGVNYGETSAPVVKYTSIQTILALPTCYGWSLYQMDVKTTFLMQDTRSNKYTEHK
jgi:hypothetical protein